MWEPPGRHRAGGSQGRTRRLRPDPVRPGHGRFYSEADAADAEFDVAQARARIGGFGARLGAGVMVPVGETVQVGAGAHLVWHGQVSFTETGQTLSSLLWIQPALRVETVLR